MTNRTRIFSGLLLVIVALFIGLFVWFKNLTGRVFVSLVSPVGVATPTPKRYPNTIVEHFSQNQPFDILLLGYGGGRHDGTYLTDSIIDVHVDPVNRRVTLISLPRDLWITLPDGTSRKINAAYSEGVSLGAAQAGKLARDAAAQVLGFPVDYFVSLNFSGFVKTIDTLGGVDINVDVAFTDPQYPVEGKENDLCGHDPADLPAITATASATANPQTIFPCRYEVLQFKKGLTHMNGATALKYIRSRHSLEDGSDFGRARRQKNLLLAVKQKVLSLNFLPKSLTFINSLGDDARTDLTLDEVRELLSRSSELVDYQIASIALTDDNVLFDSASPDGQFILIPREGIGNWQVVNDWIAAQFVPPTSTPTRAPSPLPNR